MATSAPTSGYTWLPGGRASHVRLRNLINNSWGYIISKAWGDWRQYGAKEGGQCNRQSELVGGEQFFIFHIVNQRGKARLAGQARGKQQWDPPSRVTNH